jgi:hypothetical protein
MYLLWKDDNPEMLWDHFRWDQIVPEEIQTMKPLKIGITGKSDPMVIQLADSIIAGATGDASLANSPVSLAA